MVISYKLINKLLVFILIAIVDCYRTPGRNHLSKDKNHHGFSNNNKRDTSTFGQSLATRNGSSDPEVNKRRAKLARYVVHNSNWASIATVSRLDDWKGLPIVNILSIVDGPSDHSTGIPYFYMTPIGDSAKDIEENNNVCLAMSRQQDGYCSKRHLDIDDPRCGGVGMLGQVIKLQTGTDEYEFARKSLVERYPNMPNWSVTLKFFIAKLVIRDVVLVDGNGDLKCIPLDVYYNTEPQNRLESVSF